MVTLVVLLDLSAAFDTAEHTTLLDILRTRFGITGSALNWHKSYLSDRLYRIVTGGAESNVTTDFDCGLPRGSCQEATSSLSSLRIRRWIAGSRQPTQNIVREFAHDSQLSKQMLVSEIHVEKNVQWSTASQILNSGGAVLTD